MLIEFKKADTITPADKLICWAKSRSNIKLLLHLKLPTRNKEIKQFVCDEVRNALIKQFTHMGYMDKHYNTHNLLDLFNWINRSNALPGEGKRILLTDPFFSSKVFIPCVTLFNTDLNGKVFVEAMFNGQGTTIENYAINQFLLENDLLIHEVF